MRGHGGDRPDGGAALAVVAVLGGAAVLAGAAGCAAVSPGGPPGASEPTPTRAAAVETSARDRGVLFRAVGNEPGWTLEIFEDRMVWVGDYGSTTIDVPRPDPTTRGETTELIAAADGRRLDVRIVTRPCRDTMSGQSFPTLVMLDVDDRSLRGCGRFIEPD